MDYQVLIIGGGASGLTAAISAARCGTKTAVVEKLPRVGKKLLATGNGRCNLWNENAIPDRYCADTAFLKPAFDAFSSDEARRFFAGLGISLRPGENGCFYPASNQAAAVLDCLRLTASECGAEEICDFDVTSVQPVRGGFRVSSSDGRAFTSRCVIVATGGMAAPNLGGNGSFKKLLSPFQHRFSPCLPALASLTTHPDDVAGLKGLKYAGEIALLVDGRRVQTEKGEILFAENGISGIAAMQLSVQAVRALHQKRRVAVCMSLLPMSEKEAAFFLQERRALLGNRRLEDFLTGVIVKRIAQAALKRADAVPLSRPVSSLTAQELHRLAAELTGWQVNIIGTGGFDGAQVMLGGTLTNDFCPDTLESRLVPGLYACGELLDVTGPCGGYNLTWAWASGILAGRSAAKKI